MIVVSLGGAHLAAQTPATAGYVDFSYGTTGTGTPTGEKPESKLWFADGSWWGSLYNNSAQAYHIYKFNASTQAWKDTGTQLDDRNSTKSDCLWDAANNRLYVASHVFTTKAAATTSSSSWGRLYRYTYSPSSQTYTLDSGFPVNINKAKSEALVIAKDSTGQLWATWVQSGKVMVNRTNGGDATWGTPFILPVSSTTISVTSDDISSVSTFGVGQVGIMWSNQNTHKTYFSVHDDAAGDTTWKTPEVALPGASGTETSDDHINIKTVQGGASGYVYAAVKTSLTGSNDPLIMLLVRDPTGVWSKYTFGRKKDHHTRPIVLIDEEHGVIHMFATSPEDSGVIYRKTTSISNIAFPVGLGEVFIKSSSNVNVNNVTSTKQNLSSSTGLLVLASDVQTRMYLHGYVPLQ